MILVIYGVKLIFQSRYGDHALAILSRKLPTSQYGSMKIAEDVLSLVRLLIRRSRGEVTCMLEYKRRQSAEHAQAGLFHCVLSTFNGNIRVLELVKLILENGFDLEARDFNGNTPASLLNVLHS